jgi:GNAT superfamily N-acetyltransferase
VPTIRPATRADIPQLQIIRAAVRENVLRNPGRVTTADYEAHIDGRGRTWVAELDGAIVGFVAADGQQRWLWALFVDPAHEGRGVARALLPAALAWLRDLGAASVGLTTEPGTRAEKFYRAAGFVARGLEHGELRFELELRGQ